MATLASTDVTVTIQRTRINRGSPGGQRNNLAKVAFGDGSLTYPSGGVTLPTFVSFGLVRELEYVVIVDGNDAVGSLWKYDYETKKLRNYLSGTELTTGAAPAAQVLYVEAKGW